MNKQKNNMIDLGNLPKAIIVDIDGTLAYMINRTPFEYHKAITDGVHYDVLDVVKKYKEDDCEIILLSGRDGGCRDVTLEWIMTNDIPYDELCMRTHKDNRPDDIVKEELYNQYVRDKYNVLFVLDDRNRVVDMWRKIGLRCFQVAEGNF